jgi:3-hydroxyisobutyrate dehydrogenase
MGAAMAGRLLAAGVDVRIYNRTAARATPLIAHGARLFDTPRAACHSVEAIVSMVSDDSASREVWLGASGALTCDFKHPVSLIECSTLSHGWVLELAATARARGLGYVDAPVTGLPDAAAVGSLTLLVGAATADLEACRPLLSLLGNRIVHFGPVGNGTAYKLIINLLGAVQIASVAESLALAERVGLDLNAVEAALGSGQAASPQVVRAARRIVAADHDQDIVFTPRLRLKDVNYAIALSQDIGLGSPFGVLAQSTFAELCERGRAECNESAVIEVARDRPPGVVE